MLDRWLRGPVRRLSREAPVPVVDAEAADDCAGGAANTAVNLAAMGARVRLMTLIGDDDEGRVLLDILHRRGVDVSGILVRPHAATTSKTRVVGDEQILVRVDRAATTLESEDRAQWDAALAALSDHEIVVLCDYDTGLFDDVAIATLSRARPRRVIIDAHDVGRWASVRPDIVTPNAYETELLLGERLEDRSRPGAVEKAAPRLLRRSGARAMVVTLDRDGTVAIEQGRVVGRTTTHPAPEHRAAGAGDTFVAALAVGHAVGLSVPDAARLAQAAADVVVRREGTAVCTLSDLEQTVSARPVREVPIASVSETCRAVDDARAHGRSIVFTNGCFDVLHLGHTVHLQQARALGDLLIVALNDDASVARLKGPGRPINALPDRARMLAALDCVDLITVFHEDSPAELLRTLRPDVYVKGGDHSADTLPESSIVREYGGAVRILDLLPAHSTSTLARRLREGVPAA